MLCVRRPWMKLSYVFSNHHKTLLSGDRLLIWSELCRGGDSCDGETQRLWPVFGSGDVTSAWNDVTTNSCGCPPEVITVVDGKNDPECRQCVGGMPPFPLPEFKHCGLLEVEEDRWCAWPEIRSPSWGCCCCCCCPPSAPCSRSRKLLLWISPGLWRSRIGRGWSCEEDLEDRRFMLPAQELPLDEWCREEELREAFPDERLWAFAWVPTDCEEWRWHVIGIVDSAPPRQSDTGRRWWCESVEAIECRCEEAAGRWERWFSWWPPDGTAPPPTLPLTAGEVCVPLVREEMSEVGRLDDERCDRNTECLVPPTPVKGKRRSIGGSWDGNDASP